MSKLNRIFSTIPVKIPDRSGFDLSHEILTTAKTGTVVPITTIEVLPGDTFSMGSMMKVTLPPMAVPFMGRIDAELTAAFIPNRLLWNGWQSFITQNDGISTYGHAGRFTPGDSAGQTSGATGAVPEYVPYFQPSASRGTVGTANYDINKDHMGAGSLADYLGFHVKETQLSGGYETPMNALPFLAYHKFCDDWIRCEEIQKPFFPKVNYLTMGGYDASVQWNDFAAHLLPFTNRSVGSYGSTDQGDNPPSGHGSLRLFKPTYNASQQYLPFDVTIGLGDLRQRCWAKDYFTSATTRPQAGAAASVTFDTSGQTSNFTIATLRAANSLQKWLERNNLAGTEYGSQILAHFGVTPPDATLNRSVLLGSVRTPVFVGSVDNNSGTAQENPKNPYGSALGSAAGFGSASDKGSLIDNFTAKEHGYIMVFFTLIPHAYYNTGVLRQNLHIGVGDYAWPEFANIGDQPIYAGELATTQNWKSVFGYQQRYVEYKFVPDRVNGLLREDQNLAPYALQRGFDENPTLGSDFLEIPTDYLDQVLGVSTDVGGFGCIVDAYFDCRALRVLPEYSLPSL